MPSGDGAAADVCGTPDPRDLARVAQAKTCSDKAIGDAVAAVGSNALTDVYQARTPNVAAGEPAIDTGDEEVPSPKGDEPLDKALNLLKTKTA